MYSIFNYCERKEKEERERERESSNVHVMTRKLLPSNGMLIIASGMHLEQSTRTVELLATLSTLNLLMQQP